MSPDITHRQWLAGASLTLGAGLTLSGSTAAARTDRPAKEPFGYCLNTSTISGQKLKLVEVIEITARAGYEGIEPWTRELDQHVKDGGNLKDIGKRCRDRGLSIEGVIGFFDWVVDDDAKRSKGLEEARRCLDMVQQIGGKRLAAPPVGATNQTDLSLLKAAERYRDLLVLGDGFGVVPQVELWGFSKALGRLGEVTMVAIESQHPKACVLLDIYHLYKGGSDFGSLRLINGAQAHLIHCNDYPDKPPRAEIADAQRVYPGDGVAPLKSIFRDLRDIGFRGMLSLELFNRDYWKQDPLAVAAEGIRKMRTAVQASLT